MFSYSPTWTSLTEYTAAHIHRQNIYYFYRDILHRVMLTGAIRSLDQDACLDAGVANIPQWCLQLDGLRLPELLFQ